LVFIIYNLLACPSGQFISWWKVTPLNKYLLAALLLILGGVFLILGNKFFDYLAAVIVAAGFAILIKSLIAPFYDLHFWCKIIYLIFSCSWNWCCNCSILFHFHSYCSLFNGSIIRILCRKSSLHFNLSILAYD